MQKIKIIVVLVFVVVFILPESKVIEIILLVIYKGFLRTTEASASLRKVFY